MSAAEHAEAVERANHDKRREQLISRIVRKWMDLPSWARREPAELRKLLRSEIGKD